MDAYKRRLFRRATFALCAVALLCAQPVLAQNSPIKCNKENLCELQVYIENDSFGAGTDRYYTNGFKIGGGIKADSMVESVWQKPAEQILRQVSSVADNLQFGLFLGQNMYTPRRITQGTPQPLDRPWAGWMYIGGVAQGVVGNRLHTVELDIGVVGPLAQGKLVQTEWHKLVGADAPQGWHNQLKNEPGVLLAYVGKWRYGPETGVQVVPHFGVTLGNVMTLARAGGVVRIGQHMRGFGPDTIEPGGAMLQRDPDGQSSKWDWNIFAGVDARMVARNIFLDGNTFRNGPSVEKKPYVYDLKAGLSVRVAPVHISITKIRRSEEFSTIAGGSGQQKFYSLNLSWEF